MHGTNDSRACCPEQAGRNTRIRDIVLDFVTSDQTRLWPAATDRPTSGSAGILPL